MNKLRHILAGLIALGVSSSCTQALAERADSARPKLTVCADPSNLPYSNRALAGFENEIAQVVAADLQMELDFFWFPEHQGFLRRSLLEGLCDAVMSVPTSLAVVATTKPYFSSSYVAVMRSVDSRRFTSFDDAWLKDARIGAQLVGKEGATTPPAMALGRRGVDARLEFFPMWAEDENANPQGDIVSAVADGRVDVAFVWGPFGGYFAKPYADALRVEPIAGDPKSPEQPFIYPMSVGVRKSDIALRDRLEGALERRREEIQRILKAHGVPLVAEQSSKPLIEQASSPASNASPR
jgi:mxaJ protein